MNKIFGLLVASISFGVFVNVSAFAADGWYVNISSGPNFSEDAALKAPTLPTVEFTTSQKTGPIILGALGRRLPQGFRIEAELSYRQNEFEDLAVSVPATLVGTALNISADMSGKFTNLGLMGNLAYEFFKYRMGVV